MPIGKKQKRLFFRFSIKNSVLDITTLQTSAMFVHTTKLKFIHIKADLNRMSNRNLAYWKR